MVAPSDIDEAVLESAVQAAARGEAGATRRFIELMWPWLLGFIRASRLMRQLRRDEDHVMTVAERVVTRLIAEDGRRLGTYGAWRLANASKTVLDWVRIIATNVMRSYLVEQRVDVGGMPSRKHLLNEFIKCKAAEEVGFRPPTTDAQTARELVEFAQAQLETMNLRILELWLHGSTVDEISSELQLERNKAYRMHVETLATLRQRFEMRGPHHP
jgi:hypothetical protein